MNTQKTINKKQIIIITIIMICLMTVIVYQKSHEPLQQVEVATLILLLPDDTDLNTPQVKIWLDAASEEGLLVKPMYDSDFLHPWFDRSQVTGVILPDKIHKIAGNPLIDSLDQYVAQGGHLMLVYDAGIWMGDQRYAERYSRFSTLAGIDYANYKQLKDNVSTFSPVLGNSRTLTAMQIPPGKFAPYNIMRTNEKLPATNAFLIDKPLYSLATYEFPVISYDSFVTSGSYQGQVLLQTPSGNVAAGIHEHGSGKVLFINLPLGYLKGRTDGVLLHSFLRYFADDITHVPYLASVPDGVGGLVMNWHLDSNVTLFALEKLRGLGFYRQGPYSVHITAGPDVVKKGDNAGTNVAGNKKIQNWIKFFQKRNYTVGSHGGWIHDYWGINVPEQATTEFENYLELNKQALEKVTQQAVVEYSAPVGNHPEWVNNWLHENNILAYYFTGNSGMPPTRSYREGNLAYENLWAFPVLTYHEMAGFEEFHDSGLSNETTAEWLRGITDFSVKNRTVRLIYFHPRGALLYPQAMRRWLAHTEKLNTRRQFRWYTMSGLSQFLNRRLKTNWTISEADNKHTFRAENTENLQGHTWVLNKARYARPEVVEGKASINDDGNYWLISAEAVSKIKFSAELTGTR